MNLERRLPSGKGSASVPQCSHENPTTKPLGKLDRMLSVFASGMSLNTFQAKELGDTCLHTTVSSLQARHCLTFDRSNEKIKNRFGSYTRVMRYWLSGHDLERAQQIIDGKGRS